jgi:DNA polymerase-3 subunit delta
VKYKLYHGSSSYLSLEAVHSYINNLLKEDPSFSTTIIEADISQPKVIYDTLSSPTLFSKKRILFIKRIYKNKEGKMLVDKIIELLEEKNNDDILLFWEDHKVKSNTKYYKYFKTHENIEEIDPLNKRTFFTWLRKELEKNNLKIDQSVIREFAERTNYDPERCKNEIQKFKLNNPDKIITKEDIDNLTPDTLEKEVWDLIDAINQNEKEKSIQVLEKLSSQFVDGNYILSMLTRNLRLLTLTKFLLEQNKDSREISSLLRIPPFTTPNLIKSSTKYTKEKIITLYKKLSNLDYQIKTGKIDANLGLTLICPYL